MAVLLSVVQERGFGRPLPTFGLSAFVLEPTAFGLLNVQASVLTPVWARERLRWKRQWARQLEEQPPA